MNGIKIAASIAAGYLGYHVIHTPQGRQLAKDTLKLVIEKSGQAEDVVTRAVLKLLDPPHRHEDAENEAEEEECQPEIAPPSTPAPATMIMIKPPARDEEETA